jgi:alpha-1,6-mannosyltransferase
LRPGAALGILDITKYFGTTSGGIRTYLLAKARYVATRPEFKHLMVVPGPENEVTTDNGSRLYRLRGPRIPAHAPYRFLFAARTIAGIVEHERPHLIEVGSPFLVPWLAQFANRRHQAAMVWHYHSHLPRLATPGPLRADWRRRALVAGLGRYVRCLAARFPLVIAGSEFTRSVLASLGVHHVAKVPLGVDLMTFHPRRRAWAAETRAAFGLPDQPVALYAGRLAAEKRLDVVLDAWPEVERRARVRLVIVGEGPDEARLRRHRYADRVIWIPFVREREQLADLLAAVDFYLAPGPFETFGLSVLEAFASGTPVLSVEEGGGAELVRHALAGERYQDGDAGHCAEAAVWLAKQNLPFLGARARRYAERHHGWDTALDRLFDAYRGLLAGPPVGRGA